jgi:hypothetical protein
MHPTWEKIRGEKYLGFGEIVQPPVYPRLEKMDFGEYHLVV